MRIADTAVLIFVVIFNSIELSSQSGTGEPPSSQHLLYSERSARGVPPRSMRHGLGMHVLTFPEGHNAKYVKSFTIDMRPPHPREIREYEKIPPGEYVVWGSEDIAVGFWHDGPDSPGEPARKHYHDIIVRGKLGAIEMKGLHETRTLSTREKNYLKNYHPAEEM